jgi:sulfide:quinone oxidoreductase
MTSASSAVAPHARLGVVIAGGGIAALEAVLGLNALVGDRIAVTLVAPEADFTYRPPCQGRPLTLGRTQRYRLQRLADDLGVLLIPDGLAAVAPDRHEITTTSGRTVRYDALVVAVGAVPTPAFQHAITVGAQDTTDALTDLRAELERGGVRDVAFVVPGGASWTLPLYELAIMTARHGWSIGLEDARYWFITPEPEPLAIFGPAAGRAVRELLEPEGITFIGSACADVEQGVVLLDARAERVEADRILALPLLCGPRTPGLPSDADGFIPVDDRGRVPGTPDVYAAGDVTASPLKQGGLACQQADVVAEQIAAAAGASIEPGRYRPVLRGKLMTGGRDRYLRSRAGEAVEVSDLPLWWPPAKIAGRYLSSFLADRGAPEAGAAPHIGVELLLDELA